MSVQDMYIYVPENERDTSWYLFRQHYLCMVRDLDYCDEDVIQEHGIIGLDDPAEQRSSMLEFKHKLLTINEMVSIHNKGGSLKIPEPVVAKEIHDRIQNHLAIFSGVMGVFNMDVPVDDLMMLNEFDSVVCHSIPSMLKTVKTGSALDRLREIIPNVGFKAIDNMVVTPVEPDIDPVSGAKKEPVNRRDFTDDFKNNDWSKF